MCLASDRPYGQTVHTKASLHRGLDLIPVSGVGEAVGGVREAVSDEKIGGNGIEGTFNKDMTNDEMTSLRHTNKSSNPWAKRVITSGVRACAARKSARGDVLSVQNQTYSAKQKQVPQVEKADTHSHDKKAKKMKGIKVKRQRRKAQHIKCKNVDCRKQEGKIKTKKKERKYEKVTNLYGGRKYTQRHEVRR